MVHVQIDGAMSVRARAAWDRAALAWTPDLWWQQQLRARGIVDNTVHVQVDDTAMRAVWGSTRLPTYGFIYNPPGRFTIFLRETFVGPDASPTDGQLAVWLMHEIQHADPSGVRQFLTDEQDRIVAYNGQLGEGEETIVGYLYGNTAGRTMWGQDIILAQAAHRALVYLRDQKFDGPPALWSLWWPPGYSSVGTQNPRSLDPWAPFFYRPGQDLLYRHLAAKLPGHFFINVGGAWRCYGPELPRDLMDDRAVTLGDVCWRPRWPVDL